MDTSHRGIKGTGPAPAAAVRIPGARRSRRSRRGFSLTELLVVLFVTVVLTGLMFPAFKSVRERAHRLACASNQRQIGAAISLYGTDHADRLPATAFAAGPTCRPQEMMALTVGTFLGSSPPGPSGAWDGLGLLVSPLSGMYLDSPRCLYCPSHRGDHAFERYAGLFSEPPLAQPIYSNYHYVGDRTLSVNDSQVRRIENSASEVWVTDGMRTKRDYNHIHGANVLRGDCSVRWYQDDQSGNGVLDQLPDGDMPPGSGQIDKYKKLWEDVIKLEKQDTGTD